MSVSGRLTVAGKTRWTYFEIADGLFIRELGIVATHTIAYYQDRTYIDGQLEYLSSRVSADYYCDVLQRT